MTTYDAAVHSLLTGPFPKVPVSPVQFAQTLSRARLHCFVQQEDTDALRQGMEAARKEWTTPAFTQELWFSALLQDKPNAFGVLCELSQEKAFHFPMATILDGLPEALQLWALQIPKARDLWLAKSAIFSGDGGVRNRSGLTVLDDNATTQELRRKLDAQSGVFHEGMKAFIEAQGMQVLMKNGAFLHTIAYYAEPSKKHLRVAATGTLPVYDFARMEEHWPGIESCVQALLGLGLTSTECKERLRKMVSNKSADKLHTQSEHLSLPDNFYGE